MQTCWSRQIQKRASNYDQPVDFSCPDGQFIYHTASTHHSGHEDRVFSYACHKLPVTFTSIYCSWTGYVNDWDRPVVYQCPSNGFLAGVSSYHDNGKEDRRFKYKCCRASGWNMHNCAYSGWLNSYDKPVDFTVPAGKVLRGVVSIHHSWHEDRIFQYQYCSMGK